MGVLRPSRIGPRLPPTPLCDGPLTGGSHPAHQKKKEKRKQSSKVLCHTVPTLLAMHQCFVEAGDELGSAVCIPSVKQV